jgi:hypothetical protein
MNSAVIKAAMRIDDRLADASALACLMYTWAHTACDDYGRLKATPGWWAMNVVPGRASVADVEIALASLVRCGVLESYEIDDERFVRIRDWFDTQSFQELHMMRAIYPNPESGEREPSMLWKFARDRYGLRKRAPKRPKTPEFKPNGITVKPADLTVNENGPASVTVKPADLTVKGPALYTTYDSSNTDPRDDEPSKEPVPDYWENATDELVPFIGRAIASIPKYNRASRPATLDRVTGLIARLREIAPHDDAIRDMVTNWQEFHAADKKAKYGSGDPVASIRQQIGHYEPRWTVTKSKLARVAVTQSQIDARGNQPRRNESAIDELARITEGLTNGG